jgi:pSer/pThr/pTyr-binding forkhead associated (FHA) protein
MTRYVLQVGEHRFALTPGRWRIGRDEDSEVRLDDDSVSRRHAVLEVDANGVRIEDAGSRNGVKVNGTRIREATALTLGDRIEIGSQRLTLGELGPPHRVEAATQPLPRVPKRGEESLALLSPREREVFERLARGETQREVAESLGLSVKTVETYRARIGDKLGLKSRAELVEVALQTGVLRPR